MSIHNVMFEGIFQRVIANPKKSRKREGNKKGKINNISFFVCYHLIRRLRILIFQTFLFSITKVFFLCCNLGSYKKKGYNFFVSFFQCYLKPSLLILTEKLVNTVFNIPFTCTLFSPSFFLRFTLIPFSFDLLLFLFSQLFTTWA